MNQYPFLFHITLEGGGEINRLVWGADYENAFEKASAVFPNCEIRNSNIE